MADFLDTFITQLLHLDDVRGNRMLDLGDSAGDGSKAYRLYAPSGSNHARTMLEVIRRRRGKPSNLTVLEGSAIVRSVADNPTVEKWNWCNLNGERDPVALDKFISEAYSTINLKGNNPLFLGIGVMTWQIAYGKEIRQINTPLLIFPIRLVRGSNTTPVEIEFIDDDAYFNPCLINKMIAEFTGGIADSFPDPNGSRDFDEPVNLDILGDGVDYLQSVEAYVETLKPKSGEPTIRFDKDAIVIAQYNHSDMCMYYDVRRNKKKIYANKLVGQVFGREEKQDAPALDAVEIAPVLPIDSFQTELIRDIAAGKSVIVKGPPGTGKTLTIANMIATLLARGKKILVASEKIAALAEVYAKLPEPLRKFVMLLEYETEKKAAEFNPAVLRSEFKQLVVKRKEYVYNTANDTKYQRATRARDEAQAYLASYRKAVFDEDSVWGSYYDTLDLYHKNADLPVVKFAEGVAAAAISREQYNRLILRVKDGAAHYAEFARGGSVKDSPWFGVTHEVDTESAMRLLEDIKLDMQSVVGAVSPFVDAFPEIDWDNVTYGNICDGAAQTVLSRDGMQKTLVNLTDDDLSDLEARLATFDEVKSYGNKAGVRTLNKACFDIITCSAVSALTVDELELVAKHTDLFLTDGSAEARGKHAEKFVDTFNRIIALIDERDALIPEIKYTFTKAENADDILKYGKALVKYAGADKDKPTVFDFKAKSAHKKLLPLCVRTDVTLDEMAQSVNKQLRVKSCEGEIEALLGLLAPIMGKSSMTAEERDSVFAVARHFRKSGVDIFEFVKICKDAYAAIEAGLEIATLGEIKVGDIINSIRYEQARNSLALAAKKLCADYAIETVGDEYDTALAMARLLRIRKSPAFGDRTVALTFVTQMQRAGSRLSEIVTDVADKLKAFGEQYFVNDYARDPDNVTFGRSKTFIAQAGDRSVINAAISYGDVKADPENALPLDKFFAPIESGEIKVAPERFADMFVRSHIALVIDFRLSLLGPIRNGLCANAERMLVRFRDAENDIFECNALKTEKLCMSRIDPEDDDFDFLQVDRGIKTSLRKMFKQHARAILKLKRCIILSPSTASVLFRDEQYEDFDVVIVDEASQMEPVDMLPVLFRSKQCVMVGDEYQMPPLSHFQVKNNARIADLDSKLTVDPDISALSLATGHQAFDTSELKCHYRSMTESLIEFSQRSFYKDMRTFPATVPATDDLGFEDIYTPDGVCDDGMNRVEAEAAVAALRAHFDRYYDKDTKKLAQAVGVVTFGEKQLKCVKSLLAKDRELDGMINDAIGAFDDVPDKLVFFRTIETVQGQETDHIILSLTYGKIKSGAIKKHFGDLNRDAIGANIFNVAVTRARARVTVIHSVTSQEISGNPSIAFICDYLACAEKYAKRGRGQFVSRPPEKGGNFVDSVVKYLRDECGIAEDRLVVNYGVTLGSVRIPIAVLSPDLGHAELGIWCEFPVLKKYDYYDYNVRYVESLKSRGWTLHKVYANDWYDNNEAEKASLADDVAKYVTR